MCMQCHAILPTHTYSTFDFCTCAAPCLSETPLWSIMPSLIYKHLQIAGETQQFEPESGSKKLNMRAQSIPTWHSCWRHFLWYCWRFKRGARVESGEFPSLLQSDFQETLVTPGFLFTISPASQPPDVLCLNHQLHMGPGNILQVIYSIVVGSE